ncbi:MAG: hypothetical protein M1372_00480 [Patescibacteria group bacterium]|nr:hypothetical protein [Patescibacteria group bacterium]
MGLEKRGHGNRSNIVIPIIPRDTREAKKGKGRKISILSRLAGSKLVDAALALASIGGGIQIAHTINSDIPSVPGLYEEAKQAVEGLFPNSGPPSKGDFFNPKASSGEISSLNTVPLPIDQQIALINSRTDQDGSLYFILPNPGPNTIDYERDMGQYSPFIRFKNLPVGSVFVSPYSGAIRYEKYYTGDAHPYGTTVKVKFQVRQSDGKFIDKYIEFSFGNESGKLLIPDPTALQPPPQLGTVVGPETPIKAGQPIFEITSDKTITSGYGNYQVVITGGDIPSNNNKSIVVP